MGTKLFSFSFHWGFGPAAWCSAVFQHARGFCRRLWHFNGTRCRGPDFWVEGCTNNVIVRQQHLPQWKGERGNMLNIRVICYGGTTSQTLRRDGRRTADSRCSRIVLPFIPGWKNKSLKALESFLGVHLAALQWLVRGERTPFRFLLCIEAGEHARIRWCGVRRPFSTASQIRAGWLTCIPEPSTASPDCLIVIPSFKTLTEVVWFVVEFISIQ